MDLDPFANRLLRLTVDSYFDTSEDGVALAVQMTTLPHGAVYASQTTLNAQATHIQVVIGNAGHRPMAR